MRLGKSPEFYIRTENDCPKPVSLDYQFLIGYAPFILRIAPASGFVLFHYAVLLGCLIKIVKS